MSIKKQVFLSLETAKKMWYGLVQNTQENKKSDIKDATIQFLLDNFTKEELEAKELPKSWKELEKVTGYFITTHSEIVKNLELPNNREHRNLFPNRELAEASLALSQLLQLKDRYNGDWEVDLSNGKDKYIIYNSYNTIFRSTSGNGGNYILSFKSEEIRDEFYNNFKDDLLLKALPFL